MIFCTGFLLAWLLGSRMRMVAAVKVTNKIHSMIEWKWRNIIFLEKFAGYIHVQLNIHCDLKKKWEKEISENVTNQSKSRETKAVPSGKVIVFRKHLSFQKISPKKKNKSCSSYHLELEAIIT